MLRRLTNCVARQSLAVTALAWLINVAAAQAGTINLQLLDMDLIYNNASTGSLYDLKGFVGGNMSADESDELEGAVFELDGTPITGSPFMNNMWGDFRLTGVGQLTNGLSFSLVGANNNSFGFNWWDDAGHFLKLNFSQLNVALSNSVFIVTGQATSLAGQSLPGGLAFAASQPIVISFTATLPTVIPASGPITSAMASGVMSISGTMVPEPWSLSVAAALAVGSVVGARRRR